MDKRNNRLQNLALEKFSKVRPTIDYYRGVKSISALDAYILYRLVTKACPVGSIWVFDFFDDENDMISVNELVWIDKRTDVYKYELFKDFLLSE